MYENENIVAKYGGTSMAQPDIVAGIVEAHPEQKVIVVSAPGKAPGVDEKMTDTLIRYGRAFVTGSQLAGELRDGIIDRFDSLYDSLGNDDRSQLKDLAAKRLTPYYNQLREDGIDYFAAQGEFLSAMYFARLVGLSVVEPLIHFSPDGQLDKKSTFERIKYWAAMWNQCERRLVAGFFGYDSNGKTHLLGRGGSDRTGAFYAATLGFDYENWTDVDGVYSADPRVVDNVRLNTELTREEVREGAHGGSGVLQGDTILDLQDSGVVITLRNTFNPDAPGTRIVANANQFNNREIDATRPIIAVSGRALAEFTIRDMGMAESHGYLAKIVNKAGELGLSIEHLPASQDAATLTFHNEVDSNALLELEASALNYAISSRPEIQISEKGVVYVIGEALRSPMVVMRTLGRIIKLLDDRNLVFETPVSHPASPSLALLTKREDVQPILTALHDEFIVNPQT